LIYLYCEINDSNYFESLSLLVLTILTMFLIDAPNPLPSSYAGGLTAMCFIVAVIFFARIILSRYERFVAEQHHLTALRTKRMMGDPKAKRPTPAASTLPTARSSVVGKELAPHTVTGASTTSPTAAMSASTTPVVDDAPRSSLVPTTELVPSTGDHAILPAVVRAPAESVVEGSPAVALAAAVPAAAPAEATLVHHPDLANDDAFYAEATAAPSTETGGDGAAAAAPIAALPVPIPASEVLQNDDDFYRAAATSVVEPPPPPASAPADGADDNAPPPPAPAPTTDE
jgi:hypothetical protein